MSIQFKCSSCGRVLHSPEGTSGKKARCGSCGNIQVIPPLSSEQEALAVLAEAEANAPAAPLPQAAGEPTEVCPRCGEMRPVGEPCPACMVDDRLPKEEQHKTPRWKIIALGGVIAAILTVVIVLVVTYEKPPEPPPGEPGGYLGVVYKSLKTAGNVSCQQQLSNFYHALQIYTSANDGKFPPSEQELYTSLEVGGKEGFTCPDKKHAQYKYVPGLSMTSRPTAVLIYEDTATHSGYVNALTVNGKIVKMTEQQVKQAVDLSVSDATAQP